MTDGSAYSYGGDGYFGGYGPGGGGGYSEYNTNLHAHYNYNSCLPSISPYLSHSNSNQSCEFSAAMIGLQPDDLLVYKLILRKFLTMGPRGYLKLN